MRIMRLTTFLVLFAGGARAQAPPDVIDPKDDFQGHTVDSPLALSASMWSADDYLFVSDPNSDGSKLITSIGPLGTAWFKPDATAPGEKVSEGAIKVWCDVDLQEDDPAKNVGACFRSAAILVSRGKFLVTARVYVTVNDAASPGSAVVKLHVIVKDTVAGTTEEGTVSIDESAGKLQVSGTLTVDIPDGAAGGDVKANFGSKDITAQIGIPASLTTHVGIQIRKPANTDIKIPGTDISSPTIDNLDSSHI